MQCNSALHFVCPECYLKLGRSNCPSCRDNIIFHNKLLERNLKEIIKECPYSECKRQLFEWDLETHSTDCTFGPSKCFFCEAIVNSDEYRDHLVTECDGLEWIARDRVETKGSLGLLSHMRWKSKGFKIEDSQQIQSNFAILWNNMILMARREECRWIVAVLADTPMQLDTYFKYFSSKVYEIQTIVVINSIRTCKELPAVKDLAYLPVDSSKFEFVVCELKEDEDQLSISRCPKNSAAKQVF